MSNSIDINSEDKEILAEIMNIAFGRASADLAEIIDIYVSLSIPFVEVLNSDNLVDYIQSEIKDLERMSVVKQNFWGELKGVGLLVLSNDAGKKLINLMQTEDQIFPQDNSNIDMLEQETLLEIGNILIGACIGKMVELLGDLVSYSPPQTIFSEKTEGVLLKDIIDKNNSAIVLKTLFQFKEQDVSGHLFILTSNESTDWLKKALNRFMQSYE